MTAAGQGNRGDQRGHGARPGEEGERPLTPDALRELLEQVRDGSIAVPRALARLSGVGDLGFAQVDHARAARCGFPEVVLCQHKAAAEAAAIAQEILQQAPRVLMTRASPAHAAAALERLPQAMYHERARCVVVDPEPLPRIGRVALVAAGTADLSVADEARVTAETMGAAVDLHLDVGVAGLHRLLQRLPEIRAANVAIAVAGMEGALPSLLAGLVDVPVLAVPTSVGYGANLGGVAALLAMLNSCAAGTAVVNIDNGFGAGYLAARINRLAERGAAGDPGPRGAAGPGEGGDSRAGA